MPGVEPRRTRGWWVIALFVPAHNIWAVATRRKTLSEQMRDYRRRAPVLAPLLGLGLLAHVMGYLDRRADPLYWLGVAAEHVAELARKCRRPGVGSSVHPGAV